jgi:hypothetical protein
MAVTGWVPSCLTLETVREGLIQLIGQSQNASSCTQCVCVPGNSAETSSDRASPKRKFLQSHLPGTKLSINPPSSSYKKAIPRFRYHQAAARSAFRATTRPPRPKRLPFATIRMARPAGALPWQLSQWLPAYTCPFSMCQGKMDTASEQG